MNPSPGFLKDGLTRLLITGLWLFMIPLVSQAQTPYFKSVEPSNNIDLTQVNLLFQDTSGFIWLGTTEGLFKYTGLEYVPYKLNDSISDQSVTAILQDSHGTFWIGYKSGDIALIRNNQLSLFDPEEGLPKAAITGILQDKSTIWFATYGEGIYYYSNERLYNIDTDDNLNANEIYGIAMDPKGRVWAGTDAGIAICNLDKGSKQVKQITTGDGLPDNIVYQLQPDDNGNIWIGMYDGGICYYNSESLDLTIPKSMDHWSYGAVSSIAISNNGNVWIGTEKNGILTLDPRSRLSLITRQPTKLFDLLADDQGQIWVADQDGVHTANQSLEFINFDLDSNYGNVQALSLDADDNLWFSTPNGLYLATFSNGSTPEINKYTLSTTPDDLNIISIYIDKFGFLWLGTFGQGVYRFKPHSGSVDHIDESHGLINNNVLSITGSGSEVWLATLGGVSKCMLSRSANSSSFRFENFSGDDGIGVNYIYKVFIDSEGREWFATDGKGIALLEGGKFTSYAEEQGVDHRIISIAEDLSGRMWFSSPDNGIYSFDGTQFHHFSTNEGLNDLAISSLVTDKNGNIIVVSQSGLSVVDPLTGHVLGYGEESGVSDIDPDINSVATDRYGNAFIGTQKGIIKFIGTATTLLLPNTSLNSINLYLEPISVQNGHSFKYNEDHISFDYIGLWYRDPKAVSYQHKLEGFDIAWITSGDLTATYPKLAPGKYRFMVRSAINETFENSSLEQFEFVIEAPFWRKPWFHIASFLTGSLVLAALIKAREARLKKAERTKNELMEAEFETLKSQVNPHFLFNSFNTLIGTIEENKEKAVEYVEKLSDFFRNMLAYRQKSLIKVQEELDLVMNYFFLQQKRFGSNLKIDISISTEKRDYFVPPLTLQMLVENALKHNIISKTKPLYLTIFDRDNYLFIKNNLQLKKRLEPSTGFGLQSIIRRYQLLSDQPVKIENEFKHYQVGIPLLKKSKHGSINN